VCSISKRFAGRWNGAPAASRTGNAESPRYAPIRGARRQSHAGQPFVRMTLSISGASNRPMHLLTTVGRFKRWWKLD